MAFKNFIRRRFQSIYYHKIACSECLLSAAIPGEQYDEVYRLSQAA